mgnify:CR=1 FL=1
MVAVSWVWRWMYQPLPLGVFNNALVALGMDVQPFLSSPSQALLCIVVTTVWVEFGYCVVIFLAGIQTIPEEYLEAARIDGCGEWMIYTKIILPNIKPVLSALGIFGFMSSWNAFLWPLLVVNDNRHRTVQLGVQFFSQQYGDLVHLKITAAAMAVIPIVIIYLILQKQFIQGITMTGMKESLNVATAFGIAAYLLRFGKSIT